MKVLIIRFGIGQNSIIAAYEPDKLVFRAGEELHLTKEEVEEYLKSNQVYIALVDKEEKDMTFKN